MRVQDVLAVVDALSDAGLPFWLDGGWGVDALLGEQTRAHSDLDVVVMLEQLPDVRSALEPLGFELAGDHLPTRAVLRSDDGRQVDVHPVTFDDAGIGWQRGAAHDGTDCPYPADGFTSGSLVGRRVRCLTAELQVEHHRGYEPRAHDRADMEALGRALGVELPPPY